MDVKVKHRLIPVITLALLMVTMTGAALYSTASTAHAEVAGPCEATIAGVDLALVKSGKTSDAIPVGADERIIVTMASTSETGFANHTIELEFLDGAPITVEERTDDGETSFTETVDVGDYAFAGAGLYKVRGTADLADGTPCAGAALVEVEGNPLTTVAGAVAGGTLLVGTAAAATTGLFSALGKPFGEVGQMVDEAWQEEAPQRDATIDQQMREDRAQREEDVERGLANALFGGSLFGCISLAFVALIMLPFAAVAGGTTAPPPATTTGSHHLPRAAWRPRITLAGLVAGLLSGAALVVLLQQYAVLFPSVALLVGLAIGGALVYGIAVPTLGRTIGWVRTNGKISKLEQRMNQG